MFSSHTEGSTVTDGLWVVAAVAVYAKLEVMAVGMEECVTT